jgi:outer membrane receptor protein involved in Fe transport
VSSYKYGAEWQPIDDFRLRASFQRAVRAPNVIELFTPQSLGLWGGSDPCAGSDPTSLNPFATLANCEKTGMTASQYTKTPQCISGQCGGLFGGNLHLQPETSDTTEFGVVFTPTFLDGFTATVDYFDIDLEGAIGVIPQGNILQLCATQGILCDLIHRGTAGAIFGTGAGAGYVVSTNVNTGAIKTKGVDVEANYTTALDNWGMGPNGSLNFNFLGTWTDQYRVTPYPGFVNTHFDPATGNPTHTTDFYECSGLFGLTCGTPIPKWRHKLRMTWTAPWDFDISLEWRHMSGVKFDCNKTEDALGGPNPGCFAATHLSGFCDLSDQSISSYDYIDLAGDYTVREGISIHAGIQNLMDKDPPILDSNTLGVSSPPFGNGNTYPQVYDSLGRTIFVGVTVKY